MEDEITPEIQDQLDRLTATLLDIWIQKRTLEANHTACKGNPETTASSTTE